jgi:Zn-dependent membrane protease YugP
MMIWLILVLPALLFGLWAQFRVQSAYARASRIRSRRGLTGERVARQILAAEGVDDVAVEPTHGFLSDHYHPIAKKLRLSEQNYAGDSLAAVGVAAHEVGHAIQDARHYFPMKVRSALVPAVQVGSFLGQIAILGGLFFAYSGLGHTLLLAGILGYVAIFLFALVTLPVEFDASRRALRVLADGGLVAPDEMPEVRKVLTAAGLTYVASAVSVLATLLHLIFIYGATRDE